MDWGAPLAHWLLGQIEAMPVHVLRSSLESRTIERALGRLLGEAEAEELRALMDQPARSAERLPTVLLPGITGSLLASTAGIGTLLWFNPTVLVNGHINLLDLNEDGTADATPDVDVQPVGIEKLSYLKAIVTLAKETRLYEFPYDWRRALEWNAARLATLLERWASATPSRRFVLVAHSMGGLVALSYLALYPREAERRIARVIMLGTPLRGAAAAVAMFQGAAMPVRVVARLHPNNDMGRLVRSMPAAYQLLPAPPDCFSAERAYPANWDLYDPTAWPVPMRPDYLAQAARHWRRLASADPQVELVEIAGCHQSTVTDILRRDAKEAPGATYEEVFRETGDDSGDEQVPLWSTRLPGVHTYYVEEAHQMLPSNNAVLAAVVSLVHGGQPELPDSVPPPRHVITRLRMAPLAQRAAELRERLEQGEYSREDLWRLFLGE